MEPDAERAYELASMPSEARVAREEQGAREEEEAPREQLVPQQEEEEGEVEVVAAAAEEVAARRYSPIPQVQAQQPFLPLQQQERHPAARQVAPHSWLCSSRAGHVKVSTN